jgi:hypothetical protein
VLEGCPDKNQQKVRYTPGLEVSVYCRNQGVMVRELTQLLQATTKHGWRLYALACEAESGFSYHLRLIVGPSASLFSSAINASAVTRQITTNLTSYLRNYASSQPQGVDRLEYAETVLEVRL